MRFRPVLFITLLARLSSAQEPGAARGVAGITLSGVVRDSVAHMPLSGAVVQLVAADGEARSNRSAISDALGRFSLADVAAGRYTIGFLHPILDSLGVEPLLKQVIVDGRRPVRVDLATPSPVQLRAAICGPATGTESGAAIAGIVRDARNRAPAAGVTVTGEWLELTITREGVLSRIPRVTVTTGSNGWFAMCNVPGSGTVALIASRGADSTDVIELEVPSGGYLRRELYVGSARIVPIASMPNADTLAPPRRPQRTGDGRLSGQVVSAREGNPLAGAQVSIPDGPQTRTNAQGEWALEGAPDGTRMLEVRAVGYYPERRAVDIVDGAAPIRSGLLTMKAMLDTVKITASRVRNNLTGFEDRRRSAFGRYMTPEDVARRQPIVTSDLFRNVPGVRVERTERGDSYFAVRGIFADRCASAVYIDGFNMSVLSVEEIDNFVHPDEVAGIEIYAAGTAPAQFQPGLSGCGSIVIWTKQRVAPSKRMSWGRRGLMVLGLAALALAARTMFD